MLLCEGTPGEREFYGIFYLYRQPSITEPEESLVCCSATSDI